MMAPTTPARLAPQDGDTVWLGEYRLRVRNVQVENGKVRYSGISWSEALQREVTYEVSHPLQGVHYVPSTGGTVLGIPDTASPLGIG